MVIIMSNMQSSLRPMKVSELMSTQKVKTPIKFFELEGVEPQYEETPARIFDESLNSEAYLISEENLEELDSRFEDTHWVDREEELVFGLPFKKIEQMIKFFEKNGIDVENDDLEKALQLKSIVTKFW
jgi:hypothetical protein